VGKVLLIWFGIAQVSIRVPRTEADEWVTSGPRRSAGNSLIVLGVLVETEGSPGGQGDAAALERLKPNQKG